MSGAARTARPVPAPLRAPGGPDPAAPESSRPGLTDLYGHVVTPALAGQLMSERLRTEVVGQALPGRIAHLGIETETAARHFLVPVSSLTRAERDALGTLGLRPLHTVVAGTAWLLPDADCPVAVLRGCPPLDDVPALCALLTHLRHASRDVGPLAGLLSVRPSPAALMGHDRTREEGGEGVDPAGRVRG